MLNPISVHSRTGHFKCINRAMKQNGVYNQHDFKISKPAKQQRLPPFPPKAVPECPGRLSFAISDNIQHGFFKPAQSATHRGAERHARKERQPEIPCRQEYGKKCGCTGQQQQAAKQVCNEQIGCAREHDPREPEHPVSGQWLRV